MTWGDETVIKAELQNSARELFIITVFTITELSCYLWTVLSLALRPSHLGQAVPVLGGVARAPRTKSLPRLAHAGLSLACLISY